MVYTYIYFIYAYIIFIHMPYWWYTAMKMDELSLLNVESHKKELSTKKQIRGYIMMDFKIND